MAKKLGDIILLIIKLIINELKKLYNIILKKINIILKKIAYVFGSCIITLFIIPQLL